MASKVAEDAFSCISGVSKCSNFLWIISGDYQKE